MVTVFPLLCDEQGGPPCWFLCHLTQNVPPQLFSVFLLTVILQVILQTCLQAYLQYFSSV